MIAEENRLLAEVGCDKPDATTVGMLWEFQVFFKRGVEIEECRIDSVLVRAETQDQASWHVAKAGFHVTSVGTGRPVVDWEKPYFRRDEVGAFAQRGDTAISEAIATGKLRKGATNLFSRESLLRWLEGGK